jgi:hypothetical protein
MMTDVVFKRKAKRRKWRTEKKFFRGRRRGGKRGDQAATASRETRAYFPGVS